MAGEANVWQPKTLLEVSANTKSVEEKFTATASQTIFTLTEFTYTLSTGALKVYKNGLFLAKGVDWQEQTTETFSLVVPAAVGDKIVAVGATSITGVVDVRDTDIYVTNYQAVRDYTGTEITLYPQGETTGGDGGEAFFHKQTGAAVGTFVDDGNNILVPTGGNGSIGWLRLPRAVHMLDSLALAIANKNIRVGDTVSIKELAASDAGGSLYDVVLLSTVTAKGKEIVASTGGQTPTLALVQRDTKLKTTAFDVPTVLVNIPTDFADLQQAVDYYLTSDTGSNVSVEIKIETGHKLTKGVGVYNADASHMVVTSVDATVLLDAAFVGVTGVTAGDINGDAVNNPLFYGFNAGMPQLKCLIDMGNLHGTGYYGVNSRGFVHPAAGVINAGSRGIQWRAGHIYAVKANFSGANAAGVRFHQGATGSVGSANFNNCCKTSGDSAAIYVSRGCTMEARFATATGSITGGLTCRRSIVSAGDVDVSNAATHGVRCESVGLVDFINGTASNCSGNGIVCGQNGSVAAQSATFANNALVDCNVLGNGTVGVNAATTTTTGTQKAIDYGGVDFFNLQTNQGIVVDDGGTPTFKTILGSGVHSTRYADGRQDIFGELDLTEATALVIKGTITFPEAFLAGAPPVSTITLPGTDGKWSDINDRRRISMVGQRLLTTTTMEVTVFAVAGESFTGTFINAVQVRAIGKFI